LSYANYPIIILTIPLLFEAKLTDICSEVWVVNCTESQQLLRLIKRDNLTEAEASIRIKSQISLKKKSTLADIVINNSGELNGWIDSLANLF